MRQIVLDTETTGLDPKSGHRIIEIGCVEVVDKMKTDKSFHAYINPQRKVPNEAFRVHGISTEFLLNKPLFSDIAGEFCEFISDSDLIIHNATFDMKFINHELGLIDAKEIVKNNIIDTLSLARRKFPGSPANLDALCRRFNISLAKRNKDGHGALLDSELLYMVYVCLTEGKQSEFLLNKKDEAAKKKEILKKRNVDKRSFDYIEDEMDHKKFMESLSNNIWK